MINNNLWLGSKWNELSKELEKTGQAYTYKITYPHGRRESSGDLRVVRFRENNGNYDFILAHEMFTVLPKLTP